MKVSGWASTSAMDHVRHIVAKGAFDASIRERGLQGPKAVRLLWGHDKNMPLGAITKLESRDAGLWMEADIDEDISWGRDYAAAIKAAGGLSFSVGFFLIDADFVEAPDGQEALLILRADLIEVSVVPFPANEGSEMTNFKTTEPLLQAGQAMARIKLKLEELKT